MGEGFALITVCGPDFSIVHGGENDINRHISITDMSHMWILPNNKEN